MKKFIYPIVVIAISVVLSAVGLKQNQQKHIATINPQNVTINWTAYKTTSKIPVSGVFDKVIFTNSITGVTAKEALNGLQFEIPIASINSLSKLRDGKIIKSFFGAMLNTVNLSGTIDINDHKTGNVVLKMNGVSEKLPFTYSTEGSIITLEAIMDINNWKAQAALESLNDACEDLHTGPDGESVTWSEVKILTTIQL